MMPASDSAAATGAAATGAVGAGLELTPQHPLWKAAAKAMARWSPVPPINEANVRLYYQCKELHGRCSGRLLAAEASKQRELSAGVAIETAFWLVPKTNFGGLAATGAAAPGAEQLPPDVACYQVSAATIEEQAMGCQLDLQKYYVVDQACPRQLLGMGVSQVVLQMKAVDRVVRQVDSHVDAASEVSGFTGRASTASPQPKALLDVGGFAAAAAPGAAVPAATGAVAEDSPRPSPPATKKSRTLERGHSDPAVVTKELLHNMRSAAEAGAFYSTDPNDHKTVEFWARWTLRGVRRGSPPGPWLPQPRARSRGPPPSGRRSPR